MCHSNMTSHSFELDQSQLETAFALVRALHFAATPEQAAHDAMRYFDSAVTAARWAVHIITGARADPCFETIAVRRLAALPANGEPPNSATELTTDALSANGEPACEELPNHESSGAAATSEATLHKHLLQSYLVENGAEQRLAREAVARAEVVSTRDANEHVLAVPLIAGERVTGVVTGVREARTEISPNEFADVLGMVESASVSRDAPWSASELGFLSVLTPPLAATITRARRIADAEAALQTDDLTKLHNARYFSERLVEEIKRARRYDSPIAVLFLDLDNFKSINDEHGHLVGSHVLTEMATAISASVRDTDIVARYGGDEFVVLLPETSCERAAQVAERVRATLARSTFTGGRRLRLNITASFGVAAYPEHAQSPQQLVAAADAAMYRAKALSKNCISLATPLSGTAAAAAVVVVEQ